MLFSHKVSFLNKGLNSNILNNFFKKIFEFVNKRKESDINIIFS